MKKIILALTIIPCISFASSLDMNNLSCRNMKLTASTTLKQVQDTCLIKKQKHKSGMYQVEFVNDATKDTVTCKFANNESGALLNSCR